MNIPVNNQQKLNEVIFADKNKAYGAYEIRSTYGETLFKSLTIVALTFGILMSLGYYFTHQAEDTTPIVIDQLVPHDLVTPLDLSKPLEMDKPKSTPVEPTPANSNKPNTQAIGTIVKDSLAVETNTTSVNTDLVSTGTTSTTGTGETGTGGSTGTGSMSTNGNVGGNGNDVVIIADTAPEFEGGLSALYRFISSKIIYPNVAREAGKEGTAYVRFVVDETGGVTNVITQNKLGYGLDEEAKRVIALLPKFKKPGYVNKQPVKVYYNIPIKFSMAK